MDDEILSEILRKANRDNLFQLIIERARDQGTLLQVYANGHDLETAYEGFVLETGDDAFLLQEIDDEGELDGTITMAYRSVLELREGSRLLCRLDALHGANRQEDYEAAEEGDEYSGADLIRGRLESAHANRRLINVRLASVTDFRHVAGFVRTITNAFVQFDVLTESGNPDGIATVRLEDIIAIYEDDWQIRRATKLYEQRHGLYDGAEFDAYRTPGE